MFQSQQTLIIVTEGGETPVTPVACAMRAWRDHLTVEAIEQLQACQNLLLVVCTNRSSIIKYCEQNRISYYNTGDDPRSVAFFNYLETIQTICKKFLHNGIRNISSAIVLGGAALPLAKSNDFQFLIDSLQNDQNCVWANNPLSPDVVGWAPIQSIEDIREVHTDNELAAALRDQQSLNFQLWPRTLTYNYDIDTPIDFWIAKRAQIEPISNPQLFHNVEQKLTNFLNRIHTKKLPSITLIGRISPQTVQFLNQTMKVRVRCYSEERGMKGLQRDKQGAVWSLVADWLERFAGYEEAFAQLARESDAIFMDTRVWMAHHQLVLAAEDRFSSDLLLAEEIKNRKLKQLTYAAKSCEIPVFLGGFGLVNQGLQLLLQETKK